MLQVPYYISLAYIGAALGSGIAGGYIAARCSLKLHGRALSWAQRQTESEGRAFIAEQLVRHEDTEADGRHPLLKRLLKNSAAIVLLQWLWCAALVFSMWLEKDLNGMPVWQALPGYGLCGVFVTAEEYVFTFPLLTAAAFWCFFMWAYTCKLFWKCASVTLLMPYICMFTNYWIWGAI